MITRFPPTQILLLDNRDLDSNAAGTLARMTNFLGLEPYDVAYERRDHIGTDRFGSIPEDDVTYLRGIFREDVIEFGRLTRLDVYNWPTLNLGVPIR
jgi:hypothetical protein